MIDFMALIKKIQEDLVSVVCSREPLWLIHPESDKEMLVEAYRNDIDHKIQAFEIPKSLYDAYTHAEAHFFEIKRKISRFSGLKELEEG